MNNFHKHCFYCDSSKSFDEEQGVFLCKCYDETNCVSCGVELDQESIKREMNNNIDLGYKCHSRYMLNYCNNCSKKTYGNPNSINETTHCHKNDLLGLFNCANFMTNLDIKLCNRQITIIVI